MRQFGAWFDCAAQIESSRRTSSEQVLLHMCSFMGACLVTTPCHRCSASGERQCAERYAAAGAHSGGGHTRRARQGGAEGAEEQEAQGSTERQRKKSGGNKGVRMLVATAADRCRTSPACHVQHSLRHCGTCGIGLSDARLLDS